MNTVKTQFYTFGEKDEDSFILHNGDPFGPITLAYETYGELNEDKSNVILLFHALSASQHAAGLNTHLSKENGYWTEECQVGWWDDFIGPGRALDTNNYFVVCVNWLGGCYGSTGPSSINPETGRPYGGSFPEIRANDVVNSQLRLLNHLGIDRLHAVVGSSVGGLFALNLAVRYPDVVKNVVTIAAGIEVSVLQRLYNFEQIQAIETDPKYLGGDYYDDVGPVDGLALARMISHKTFVSLSALQRRARRDVVDKNAHLGFYKINHPVESYMLHQGHKFTKRFDANTYLRILDIWQHFDLFQEANATKPSELFRNCSKQNHLVFSIDSDVCFYPEDQAKIVNALRQAKVSCQHITVHTDKGHDAFLLQPELFAPHLDYILREKW